LGGGALAAAGTDVPGFSNSHGSKRNREFSRLRRVAGWNDRWVGR
jgi:hypothetical protein